MRSNRPIVVALGGNALLRRGQRPDVASQRANVALAARAVAGLARERQVVVTHGNGPQVGWLALEAGAHASVERPLDVLDAETEGMLGYWIELALRAELPDREIATLLTQTEVDPNDAAFAAPSKPIGPVYSPEEGRRLAGERGWSLASEPGGVRRVVPSPEPRRIVELAALRRLVEAGFLIVCAGGGGIPVAPDAQGRLDGVEAVVDKDLCAALLARQLDAEGLLLLTDVEAVYRDWPERRVPLSGVTTAELRALDFDPGSMGPKVEAACRFVESGGAWAGIGALAAAQALAAGSAGTRIERAP